MLAEIKSIVQTLADLERWPPALRDRILNLLRCQPASSIADDLSHFRSKLASAQATAKVASVERHT